MTDRFSARCLLVALAFVAVAPLAAQGPRMTPDRLAELAKKPTPKLADGKSDLNGTWDHLGGIEFVRPQSLEGGSVCVVGCPPAGRGAASRRGWCTRGRRWCGTGRRPAGGATGAELPEVQAGVPGEGR